VDPQLNPYRPPGARTRAAASGSMGADYVGSDVKSLDIPFNGELGVLEGWKWWDQYRDLVLCLLSATHCSCSAREAGAILAYRRRPSDVRTC